MYQQLVLIKFPLLMKMKKRQRWLLKNQLTILVKKSQNKKQKQVIVARIGMGAGKVVATFNQAAREAIQTMLNTIIPFMAFVSLLIGVIQGSGVGNWLAKLNGSP